MDEIVMGRMAVFGWIVMLLTGCAFLPPPGWVTDREPLESCGIEDVAQGIPPTGMDVEARRCLLAAYQAGEGAEFVSTQPTVEGDSITSIYRVHPDGTVEVFIDATKDRYGSGTWVLLRCHRLLSVAEANDPPDLVYLDEMVFVEDGCEEVPNP